MKTQFLIVHPENGTYIGEFWGLGFFSNLDPAGQDSAPVFDTIDDAVSYASESLPVFADVLRYLPVQTEPGATHASMEQCVAAGAPGWITATTETLNSIPS